ncbi:MAG: DUF2281 domain-containing protein [Flavobacteriales bacterium]|jgi:mRNA-degrading endonuclease RelE of RelBE toxin-antitoxin system|nr:DUF2281 domain-containing protein [Flavobacteriales bacterium]MBK6550291.1 DUF2281 domain-containing protein [Flavobacteriales bacterium]MBK6881545.1 DUF2281 domain-containing protein [Flavobacteriales bacterium]MBK7102862.1 DUF2281 domain-containing protein [Flavobacteriales bacterium]MBK7113533.1 DUF2281 domain-containing protein [Flavobacteriales bacterium]
MASKDQYIQISSLPEDIRKQVVEFIEFLMKRRNREPEKPEKKRVAGLMKGEIHVPDDFDEPLDDFKEYMK